MYALDGLFGGCVPLTLSFILDIAFENSLSENGFWMGFSKTGIVSSTLGSSSSMIYDSSTFGLTALVL
jgi:hypothetical protein